MWRSLISTLVVLVLAWAAISWLTHDFRAYTAEGARRLVVQEAPVATPAVRVEGPGADSVPLPDLLRAHGGATIADFIYTRCISVCAALGSGFQQLQSEIRAADGPSSARVRLLSISFDPARDDPASLARHAGELHADPSIWRFVTVRDPAELRRLLRAFHVVVIDDGFAGYEHNAALLVIDADARLVRVFDYDRLAEALQFARGLPSVKASD